MEYSNAIDDTHHANTHIGSNYNDNNNYNNYSYTNNNSALEMMMAAAGGNHNYNDSLLQQYDDVANAYITDESGDGSGGGDSFFDTYFSKPRFIIETVMALLSLVINCLALISSANARNKRYSIYHILFINLCVCNALSLVLSWLSNNSLFFLSGSLPRMMANGTGICKVLVYLTSAVFVSSAFSTVSILTLLGFIIVQYIAICRPLEHSSLVRKPRVILFIFLAWLITVLGGFVPFFTLLCLADVCSGQTLLLIFRVVVIGANCCIAFMALVYTLVVLICIRIYYEVRQLQKRLSQFRYEQEVQGERKAFFTTLMLIALVTVFYIPYTAVYVFTINNSGGQEIHSSALIYYMNLLPYVKYFLDPIVYGLRMKEIREGCGRVALMCGCRKCVTPDHTALSRGTSVTSMRMRSFRHATCNGQKSGSNRYVFKSSGVGTVVTTET